jgi:hypothetical protein
MLAHDAMDRGRRPVFAIRDTVFDAHNPFSLYERQEMIRRRFDNAVDIIGLPDVDEIMIGRDPGFSINHVDVPAEMLDIRATDLRKGVMGKENGKIIWITGNSGAGKSTLARLLRPHLGAIILDGDDMRRSISTDLGFSMEDRNEQNLRVAGLAKELCKQTNVIVAVIAPTKAIRSAVTFICDPIWIWLDKGTPHPPDRPYENVGPNEIPGAIALPTDIPTEDETLIEALKWLERVNVE